MDDQNQDITQARFKNIMQQVCQLGAERLTGHIHCQHYDFAHKLVPYLVKEHFDELIYRVANNSVQQWVCELWKESGDAALTSYSLAVHPICQFVKVSDEIGVLYFVMPAPRTTGEALYTSIVFLMDEDSPSTWLRRYFSLELGALFVPSPYLQVREDGDSSVRWVLTEWDDSEHTNYGKFKFEPTLDNFLAATVAEAQASWC